MSYTRGSILTGASRDQQEGYGGSKVREVPVLVALVELLRGLPELIGAWVEQDSNLRRQCHQIYSLAPLAAWVSTRREPAPSGPSPCPVFF